MILLFLYLGIALGIFFLYAYQRIFGNRRKIVLESFEWHDPNFVLIPKKETVLVKTNSHFYPYAILDGEETPSYNERGERMRYGQIIERWAYIPTPDKKALFFKEKV